MKSTPFSRRCDTALAPSSTRPCVISPRGHRFYDALEANDSAVAVLGDETLRGIARELVETVRNNVTIDSTVHESVRANLRQLVKRT